MKLLFNRRGISIIEAILGVVVISACFLGLVVVISNTTIGNIRIDISTNSVLLAREKMSEVMAKDFDSIGSEYAGNFAGDFSGYSYSVAVQYVDMVNPDVSVPGPTGLKKIDVAVSFSGLPGTVHLYDLKVKMP